MAVEIEISLTAEQDAFARTLVEGGQYSDLSAVLQRGLDLLRQEIEVYEPEREAFRALIDKRSKGPFISLEECEAEVLSMLKNRKWARDAET